VASIPNWTDLSLNQYFALIEHLRLKGFTPFWKIEAYWTISEEN
jgi:hypothetical protein